MYICTFVVSEYTTCNYTTQYIVYPNLRIASEEMEITEQVCLRTISYHQYFEIKVLLLKQYIW